MRARRCRISCTSSELWPGSSGASGPSGARNAEKIQGESMISTLGRRAWRKQAEVAPYGLIPSESPMRVLFARRRIGRVKFRAAVVQGVGGAVPARCVPNSELAARLDTSDAWIRDRLGIASRHVASDASTVDLAVRAGARALEMAGFG